jgi:formylglycine-generating enzyme required for sulfatase activity
MRCARSSATVVAIAAALSGCFPDFSGLTGGEVTDGSPADRGVPVESGNDCTTCDVPTMDDVADAEVDAAAEVDATIDPCRVVSNGPKGIFIAASNAYCIDETEVTNGDYAKFVASQSDAGTVQQPIFCSWNTTFRPNDAGWPHPGYDQFPVSQVDWCDAWSYCKWANKRLCGKIGVGDLADVFATDPDRAQWYRACAGTGRSPYPYGTSYDARRCNGVDNVPPQLFEVKWFKDCQGHEPGLFDMSGNVYEWIDVCESVTGASDSCRTAGGAFNSPSYELACDFRAVLPRNNTTPNVGFRCCTDL